MHSSPDIQSASAPGPCSCVLPALLTEAPVAGQCASVLCVCTATQRVDPLLANAPIVNFPPRLEQLGVVSALKFGRLPHLSYVAWLEQVPGSPGVFYLAVQLYLDAVGQQGLGEGRAGSEGGLASPASMCRPPQPSPSSCKALPVLTQSTPIPFPAHPFQLCVPNSEINPGFAPDLMYHDLHTVMCLLFPEVARQAAEYG